MKKEKQLNRGMGPFLTLWSTQAFSALGSAMTSFGLIVWSYQQQGSAMTTALLSVCSYAPYVLLSIFAGIVSDRWNKKAVMLISDSLAAVTTCLVLFLLRSQQLAVWHIYVINAVNGVMNAVQQPASEVAVTVLTPKEQYQRVAGLRSFSNSLVTLLAPMLASAALAFGGMDAVILFDLMSFAAAFCALAFFIQIPRVQRDHSGRDFFWDTAKQGLLYLSQNRGILGLILFLAAINLIASVYQAALPAMLLSRAGGGQTAFGFVNTATGVANLVGSIAVSFLPAPKSRVRVICNSLLFSMCTENFLLAFGRGTPVWCFGAVLGWLTIPLMGTNLDALMRLHIPVEMQGRVYSVRNALQFFTIPVGYLLGGFLVDRVFEPLMAAQQPGSFLSLLFGSGKGSGAAALYAVLGAAGVVVCLAFRRNRRIWALEEKGHGETRLP